MEKSKYSDSMVITIKTILQFWGKQYRELWQNIHTSFKRNPTEEEIRNSFVELCERHAGICSYYGMPKESFVDLVLKFKESLMKKAPEVKDQNQLSLDFSEAQSKNLKTLTGSLDEETKVRTGFYASKTTKKYKRISR